MKKPIGIGGAPAFDEARRGRAKRNASYKNLFSKNSLSALSGDGGSSMVDDGAGQLKAEDLSGSRQMVIGAGLVRD